MKRKFAALTLASIMLTSTAHGVSIPVDNVPVEVGAAPVYHDTTFVSLRFLTGQLRPDAAVNWEKGQAVIRTVDFTLTARPGDHYLIYNGTTIPLDQPVRAEEGRVLVPIRPLAAILGAQVHWDSTKGVSLTTGMNDEIYWLSRIISAESQGEPLEGKIAVGNVVLNRVDSSDFPDSIYSVIFDDRWGGQFEPVENGTVYHEPTAESILAAHLALAGVNTVGESLYFLAPALTDDHWTMENREYVTTIGAHWFYL